MTDKSLFTINTLMQYGPKSTLKHEMYLNTNTLKSISNTFHFQGVLLCR